MKGQATAVSQVLAGLFVIGVVALLIFAFLTKYLEIHVIVRSAEVERHAINSANVLLSSKALVVQDGGKIYRAILDEEKLNEHVFFVRRDNSTFAEWWNQRKGGLFVNWFKAAINAVWLRIQGGELKEMAYPNSYVWGTIIDLEDADRGWFFASAGPFVWEKARVIENVKCLVENIKPAATWENIFNLPPLTTGDIWDYYACGVEWASKTGVSSHGFPVAIKTSDGEVHAGRMVVWLMEVI